MSSEHTRKLREETNKDKFDKFEEEDDFNKTKRKHRESSSDEELAPAREPTSDDDWIVVQLRLAKKDVKGLGKHGQGIFKPIKESTKDDSVGFAICLILSMVTAGLIIYVNGGVPGEDRSPLLRPIQSAPCPTIASAEHNGPVTHLVLVFRAGNASDAQASLVHHIRNMTGADSAQCDGARFPWLTGMAAGSEIHSFSTPDYLGVNLSVPRDASSLALSVLGHVAADPAFKEWELEDVSAWTRTPRSP